MGINGAECPRCGEKKLMHLLNSEDIMCLSCGAYFEKSNRTSNTLVKDFLEILKRSD